LHRVAVKYPGTPGAIGSSLHGVGVRKFGPSVSEQDVDIFFKKFPAKEAFQGADAVRHGRSCFFFMEEGEEYACGEEFESLEKRSIGAVIINGVHLCDKNIRVLLPVREIILIGASLQISAVLSLFIKDSFLFWKSASHLPAQIKWADACDFMEDAVFDVVIKGFLTDAQFRVDLENLIGRKPLPEERGDDIGHLFCFCTGKIDAKAGIREHKPVILMSRLGGIGVFIKPAAGPVAASVAGTWGTIPSGTAERDVFRTIKGTFSAVDAAPVIRTFQGHLTFMGKGPVQFDLLADGGLILSDSPGNGGFRGAICDPG